MTPEQIKQFVADLRQAHEDSVRHGFSRDGLDLLGTHNHMWAAHLLLMKYNITPKEQ